MEYFFRLIQPFILKTYPYWPLNKLYRQAYFLILKIFIWKFKQLPEIDSIYLRGGLTTSDWVPGNTDIDLSIVFKDISPEKEAEFLIRFYKMHNTFGKFFPLILRDVVLFSVSDLTNKPLVQRRLPRTPNSAVGRWQLLYGKEHRQKWEGPDKNQPQKILADYLIKSYYAFFLFQLYNMTFRKKMFLRSYYRHTIQIFYFIYFILNQSFPSLEDELLNYFASCHNLFSASLVAELRRLKKNNYRTNHPFEAMCSFVFGTMKTIDGFYSYLLNISNVVFTGESLISETTPELSSEFVGKSRSDQFNALNAFLKKILRERNALRSIFLIPDNCPGGQDEIYLILNESCARDSFQKIIEIIREDRAGLEKSGLSILITTINIMGGEIYFLGGYSALSYFYVMKYGQVLYGQDIKKYLKKPPKELIVCKFNELRLVALRVFHLIFASQASIFNSEIYDILNYRLFIEKGILFDSFREIWKQYKAYYGGEKETSWFDGYHNDILENKKNEENQKKAYQFIKYLLKKFDDNEKTADQAC